MVESRKAQAREIEKTYGGIRRERSPYNFESLIAMKIFSYSKKTKFNNKFGFSNYQVLSISDAHSISIETRLENNRPRYIKQMQSLLKNGKLEMEARGVTIRYFVSGNKIMVSIGQDDGLNFHELPWKTLPRWRRKANEAILLIMAQTEVELWP